MLRRQLERYKVETGLQITVRTTGPDGRVQIAAWQRVVILVHKLYRIHEMKVMAGRVHILWGTVRCAIKMYNI